MIEKAPEHKLPLEQAIKIGIETAAGLAFAHEQNIIHRDIKPGNVWLATDGRAQVGDWGLAVAMDRTRLTQAGMMVGTVSYMPPEQAMGGEITPRSDLYALGAMLYEMVCGRPPFVGDESVAIIGQHLNTPPVAPTWHRPDCPPALEALILRLLEKDPGKRPESAAVVKEALEAVSRADEQTGRRAAERAEKSLLPAGEGGRRPDEGPLSQPSTNDPLYRRTFVGREHEVRQLQQAFDNAISGQGGLVMVVGEPDIGKTALCEQLMTYVAGFNLNSPWTGRPRVVIVPKPPSSRLGIAELLLGHYPEERDAAIEHLDFAIAEFREMKMQPSLERALRHRGLLKA